MNHFPAATASSSFSSGQPFVSNSTPTFLPTTFTHPMPSPSPISPVSVGPSFLIPLFDIGDIESCFFSWCCFPCAMAQSRTYMDGSSCLFNFFCISPVATRWLVRSAYGIPGDPWNDCLVTTCCPCCSANQLIQTTKHYGTGSNTNGGAIFNTTSWTHAYGTGSYRDCLYSFFCMPCAIGHMMENSMSMPWYLGCCCVNLCAARNLIRYQYRIRGNDLVEECAIPYGLKCFGDLTQSFFPCVWCILYGIFVAASMQQLQEVQSHTLSTTSPPPSSSIHYLGQNQLISIYSSSPTSTAGGTTGGILISPPMSAPPGGIELIQPAAITISSPFHRSNGYTRVENNGNYPSVAYSIGEPRSAKEL